MLCWVGLGWGSGAEAAPVSQQPSSLPFGIFSRRPRSGMECSDALLPRYRPEASSVCCFR